MLATIPEVIEAFQATLQDGLSVSVVQGRPALGREFVSLPCIAVEFLGFEVSPGPLPATLGAHTARRRQAGVMVHLYATNEYELWLLSDAMLVFVEATSVYQANGETVQLKWDQLLRDYGDLDAVLDYAATVSVGLNWRKN